MSRRPLPAEQPLDETSAAYRALFERNPLPMWLYDSETLAFLEVNDAAVAQYGYSRAEFLGMTILDIRPEEDRAALARETPSLGGVELQVWPAPWRHLRKDGSTCLVRVASHPLRFSGRPARLVVVQDVTETTQTADALRESREQYRFFIGRTAEGVWRAAVDPPMPVDAPESEQVDRIRHARLVEVNDAMVRMYGLASEEGLLGTLLASTFDLADPRSVDFFQTFVRSGYRTVELESHEFDRNGSPRWFVNNLLGVVEDGLLAAIWGTQRDVTEHRRREELVRATRDHLDALVQASPLPIVSLTMGGDVMSWNRAAETVFGWSAEEAVGRRLLCVPPEKQGEFDQVRNTALRSGGFTGYETVRVRKDGSRIDVSISTAPLHDAAGVPIGPGGDLPGHQRPEARRGGAASVPGADAPGPEDGGGGPAGRRRRPRFQQPADRHPGYSEMVLARSARQSRPQPRRSGPDPPGRRSRRRADPASCWRSAGGSCSARGRSISTRSSRAWTGCCGASSARTSSSAPSSARTSGRCGPTPASSSRC